MLLTAMVVDQDGPRDDRRRCHTVASLDDGLHVVGRQYFERRALGRTRQGVRILTHVEWTVRALVASVLADGLSNGQDVGFGERAPQRRTSVSAGPEADHLVGITEVRTALEILPFEPGHVHQHLLRGGLAC